MESVGEKLREARESKNISLDQVSRETNIAKKYLQALEEEDVSQFPGDTYALGFLRNYAEYLGLNTAEMITLYKNMRLQEQPVPMEALLAKKRSSLPYIIGGLIAVAALVGGGLYYFSPQLFAKKETKVVTTRGVLKVEYKGSTLEQPFIEGDEVVFPDDVGSVRVLKVGSTVELGGSFGKLVMKQGQESLLDLPGSKHLVKVTCSSVSRDEKPPKAVLKFEMTPKAVSTAPSETPGTSKAEGASAVAPVSTELDRSLRSRVILESPAKTPFTLELEFTGYSFFRYRVDNSEREEKFFRKGETFRVDAQREIYLGFSNAGSLRARVQGREVEFGKPGEVGVGVLKWTDPPGGGTPRLEFVPLF